MSAVALRTLDDDALRRGDGVDVRKRNGGDGWCRTRAIALCARGDARVMRMVSICSSAEAIVALEQCHHKVIVTCNSELAAVLAFINSVGLQRNHHEAEIAEERYNSLIFSVD